MAVIALLLVATPASAAPAAPGATTVLRQPDGTAFRADVWGDEWYNGFELGGYTILLDAHTHWWTYARVADERGRLEPGPRRAAKASPAGPRHLRDRTKLAEARTHATSRDRRATSTNTTESTSVVSGPQFPNQGTDRGLVILAQFTNSPNRGTTVASWASRFFGATNSVKSFYEQVSAGKFSIAPAAEVGGTPNDGIVGWLSLNMAHPGASGWSSAIAAAIRAADPYVNFASYDTNGNGYVDPNELHITVIAAGGEAATGCAQPAVWAFKGALLSAAPSVDGVRAGWDGFTVFGEQQCNGTVHQATIGVIAHEIGHDLGWPDEYDVDKSSAYPGTDGGVGRWSLMASGTWNAVAGGYQGTSPAHPDAFLKSYQGWLTPTLMSGAHAGVQVPQAESSPSAVQLLNNPNGVDWSFGVQSGTGEYFLVENRQRVGYDVGLPACGILIWHIDETRSAANYYANGDDTRRLVQIMDADGNGLPYQTTDPWTGARTFSDSTTPTAKLYSGTASGVKLSNFSTCAATMTLDLGSAASVPNDNFGAATAIGAFPYSQSGLATGAATIQTSEPSPSCTSLGKTVWYRFTAGADMTVTVSTAGSNFDTALAGWRGTAIGSLTQVGCNDDYGGANTSQIRFAATSGQTYYIQAGGWGDATHPSASGSLKIAITGVSSGIANDAFAGAVSVTSFPYVKTDLDTTGATVQSGEPTPTCAGIGKTVWYTFTPATDVTVTASTSGTAYDTVLQGWRGTSIGGLTGVGCNDDFAGAGGYSQITFAATAGLTYYLQVGGFKDGSTPAVGGLLDVSISVAARGPANNNFGSATTIGSLPYARTGLATGGATVQSNEPAPSCGPIGKTVWFKYTPSVNTNLTAATSGSSFDTILQVWQGTAIDSLTAVTCSDDVAEAGGPSSVQFVAAGGQTYYFQVGGYASTTETASGSLTFALSGSAASLANDAFSKATVVTALPYSQSGVDTGTATTETDEPEASCPGSIGKTVWYRWTPMVNTTMTVSSQGSDFDTVIAVWRGTSITGLTEIGCNDDFAGAGGYSKLQVSVVAGQTYFIQAGGYVDGSTPVASGSLALSVQTP